MGKGGRLAGLERVRFARFSNNRGRRQACRVRREVTSPRPERPARSPTVPAAGGQARTEIGRGFWGGRQSGRKTPPSDVGHASPVTTTWWLRASRSRRFVHRAPLYRRSCIIRVRRQSRLTCYLSRPRRSPSPPPSPQENTPAVEKARPDRAQRPSSSPPHPRLLLSSRRGVFARTVRCCASTTSSARWTRSSTPARACLPWDLASWNPSPTR